MDYHFAKVIYQEQHIGTVSWDIKKRLAAFEYTKECIQQGIPFAPIHMPTRPGVFQFSHLHESFQGLPGLLADCLPDTYGHSLIDDWLRSQGRAPEDFSPVERLCYMGHRGMGALEFQPTLRKNAPKSEQINVAALVDIASQALARKEGLSQNLIATEDLNEILRVGTSAGGARAKAVIALHPETQAIHSGQTDAPPGFSHWLLKFDGISAAFDGVRDPQGYGRIEYAYYLMAQQAGIHMAECRLLQEGGRAHFMTRRFDRPQAQQKIHLASLFGIAHMAYSAPGAHSHSYEDYFDVIEKLALSPVDKLEAFRRMCFNVLACNRDDHAKNFAFLLPEPHTHWQLSPAYDLTYAFNPQPGKWTATQQMSVVGKRQDITLADLMQLGHRCAIATKPKLKASMEQVISALQNWPQHAAAASLPASQTEKIAATIAQQIK